LPSEAKAARFQASLSYLFERGTLPAQPSTRLSHHSAFAKWGKNGVFSNHSAFAFIDINYLLLMLFVVFIG